MICLTYKNNSITAWNVDIYFNTDITFNHNYIFGV